MKLQHEYECHRRTGDNLEHERDLVKRMLVTEMRFIENILKEQRDQKYRLKQMEISQAKDARVESLQTRCEELEEKNNNISEARASSM